MDAAGVELPETGTYRDAGPETEEVALVSWGEIPWTDIAFPSVHWALNDFRQVQGRGAEAKSACERYLALAPNGRYAADAQKRVK